MIEYLNRPRRFKPKMTLSVETRKAVRWLIITLSTMIAVLSIIFIAFTSRNAEKGYTLEQMKLHNEKLKNDNSDLNSRLTTAAAFSKLEENEKLDGMSEAEVKKYITREDNTVK